MSHEFETGFFVKEKAWHGLGTILDKPPTIDDALRLAGLDWTVSTRELSAEINGNGYETVDGFKLIIRDSDHAQLGVVGAKYEIIQQAKALEVFQPLVESGLVTLEAAGSLRGGRRIWILGKIVGANADVMPGDEIRGYVVFYTSHDGSLRTAYQRTKIRVVCDNTISAAEAAGKGEEKEDRILIRHTGDVNARIDRIKGQFEVNDRKVPR
jgi:phage/plasmid-like protein (TIGR03299 family)